ncbi:MAG: GNAT family N-acetyltransferase [Halobacteriales archaeon]
MSINVDRCVVDPGSEAYLEDAWDLKERIRARAGVLKQRRGFFADAYTRSTVYIYRNPEADSDTDRNAVIGFAAVRRDGYILFLAVDPAHQGEGFGERLVALVAEDYKQVTCHARVSNEEALGFYESLGFEIIRRIDNYYEDSGDAYYLRLGEKASLTDRLSELFRR